MVKPLIARCKWCISRIGEESVRIDNVWRKISTTIIGDESDCIYTDTICPVCFEIEKQALAFPA